MEGRVTHLPWIRRTDLLRDLPPTATVDEESSGTGGDRRLGRKLTLVVSTPTA